MAEMSRRSQHFVSLDYVAVVISPLICRSSRGPATTIYGTVALPFVIPTEAKRSGGICSSADLSWKCFST